MRTHDFELKAEEGKEWEERIRPVIEGVFFKLHAERVDYADKPETQKEGVDIILEKFKIKIDIKTRENKYCCHDIFIETMSVVEKEILGWHYTTKADAIFYCWRNKYDTGISDSYLIWVQDEKFREWFKNNKAKYREVKAESKRDYLNHKSKWHTLGRVVPTQVLQNNGFIYHSGSFTFTNTDQQSLDIFQSPEPPKKTDKKLELKDFL